MIVFAYPILFLPLCLGLALLVIFSFFKRFALVGNLIGIASIVTFVILSFLFGGSYLETIIILLLVLGVWLLCNAINRRMGR